MIADGDRLLRPSSDWVPQHRECSDNSLCRCLAGYRPAGRAHELLIAAARTAPPISPRVSAARFEEVVALNNLGKACARQAGLRVTAPQGAAVIYRESAAGAGVMDSTILRRSLLGLPGGRGSEAPRQ